MSIQRISTGGSKTIDILIPTGIATGGTVSVALTPGVYSAQSSTSATTVNVGGVTVGSTVTSLSPSYGVSWPVVWSSTQSSANACYPSSISGGTAGVLSLDSGGFANGKYVISTDGLTFTVNTSSVIDAEDITQQYGPSSTIFGGGVYLFGTDRSRLVRTTDAVTWTVHDLGGIWSASTRAVKTVGFGNNLYLAFATSGDMATSTDGITWTSRNHGTGQGMNDYAYGNGLHAAVGFAGNVIWSTNGITWSQNNSALGSSNDCRAIGFGQGKFLISASGVDPYIMRSTTNFSTFTAVTQPVASVVRGIRYFSDTDTWIIVASNQSNVWSSTNGITWTQRSLGGTFNATSGGPSIIRFNGQYLLSAYSDTRNIMSTANLAGVTDTNTFIRFVGGGPYSTVA